MNRSGRDSNLRLSVASPTSLALRHHATLAIDRLIYKIPSSVARKITGIIFLIALSLTILNLQPNYVAYVSYIIRLSKILIAGLFTMQSRSSSGSDFPSGGSGSSSGFSGGDNLPSVYQRDTASSHLSYQDVKSPYLHNSAAGSKLPERSNYYGGSSSYGGGYESSYKPRNSLFPSSAPTGKQY